MNEITIMGIGASVCTATASIPQLVKIIKSQKAEDISVSMLLVLIAGLALWVCYGFFKKDIILVIANTIPLLVNTMIVIFALRYKNNK